MGSAPHPNLVVPASPEMPSIDHIPNARFERLSLIGKGSTSSVFRARRHSDGKLFAYKLVRLAGFSETQRRDILNEVDVMSRLHHPSVVQYEESFVEAETLHIVMELLEGGDLAQDIEARTESQPGAPPRLARPFDEEAIWAILVQVCEGLHHVHSQRVLHRDLKAENLFCDGHGAVKVGDLGLGRLLSAESSHARTGCASSTRCTRASPPSATT